MLIGIDLYPRWIGAEASLDGQSPYSIETRQRIWQAIYGSSEPPEGNPFGFYYPPAIVTLLAPLIIIGCPVDTAAVLWCAVSFALWFTALSLWTTKLLNHNTKRTVIIGLLLTSGALFRPAFSNYILGQNSLFCTLMLIAAWVSYRKNWDILVGILASLALIKPSLTLFPIAMFGIFYYRSVKGLLSFIVTSLLLYIPPTVILGYWIPDFLRDISQYAAENEVSWFARDITTIPGLVWLASSSILVLLGLKTKDEVLTLSSSLAFNAIFIPHTADYDLIAFAWLLSWLGDRWLHTRKWLLPAECMFLILVLFPWASLFVFLRRGFPIGVESWYRFIWLAYPVLILSAALSTYFLQSRASNAPQPSR